MAQRPRERSLDGRVAVVAGDFDDGARGVEHARSRLVARGATLREGLDDACSLLVLGGVTVRLAALLGPSAVEREASIRAARGQRIERVDARDLASWLDDARAAVAPAVDPPRREPDARLALARGTDARALDAARSLVLDPHVTDAAVRAALCARLERRGDADALAALADALCARVPCSELAAASLGRLVARGVTRWNTTHAPLAVELAGPPRGRALALARALGATESLVDDRGRALLRALPSSSRGPIARPALFELIALAGARRGTVWLGGVALPADLDAGVFRALFAPLDARARRA